MLMVEADVVGKVCCRHKNVILSKTTFFCLSFLAVHQNSPGFYQVATYIYIWRTVTHSRCSFLSKTLSENITCQTILSVRRPHRVSQLTRKTFTTVLDCCVDMYSLILAHVQMRMQYKMQYKLEALPLYVLEETAFQIKYSRGSICVK